MICLSCDCGFENISLPLTVLRAGISSCMTSQCSTTFSVRNTKYVNSQYRLWRPASIATVGHYVVAFSDHHTNLVSEVGGKTSRASLGCLPDSSG
ncbi:hypothetical protein Rmet_4304 (plasmid) [Cupriavidus metallidurans CH34]|uniref:Uncharacterized protein n=1 Tax=Cupriavidus metallidurans (strain ATCC 43123 / DSM 2839 / NBRC 102507 / CH34) TaxID=266264 RepID=Q1LFA6_CUPMC|nr:hypothetical protein Rmet_4304 [Cupriavidus metallidurans CH34]